MTDIDMARVREAAGIHRPDTDTPIEKRPNGGQIWDAQKTLADFACHVLATAVVVPREDFELILQLLPSAAERMRTIRLPSRVTEIETLIDRLAKLGVSDEP